MMGKIGVGKMNGFGAIRSERQTEVRKQDNVGPVPNNKRVNISGDTVDLSGRGSEVGKLVDQIKLLPDVREEKVKHYREQIAGGNYKPSGEKVAAAILKEERI